MSTRKPTSRRHKSTEKKKPRDSQIRKALQGDDSELEIIDARSAPQRSRKPRRNVVLDSDDEDEGEWLVGEDRCGPARLGRAGGTDDENAEGRGIELGSEDSADDVDPNASYEDDVTAGMSSDEDVARSTPSRSRRPNSKLPRHTDVIELSDSETSDAVEVDAADFSDDELPADPTTAIRASQSHLAEILTSTKINHLLGILDKEADQHKFIVFSQFTSMLDLIEPFLKRDGYRYTRYDGKMRNDLREAALRELREEKSCRVLLCSLKCGSLGLNLTAATRVVILEPFWNPVSSHPCLLPHPPNLPSSH
jgi:hypothetical protein